MPKVDPKMAEILALIAALDLPPYESMKASAARAAAEERNVFWNEGNPEVASVRDLNLPGPSVPLRLRLYEPAGVGATSKRSQSHGWLCQSPSSSICGK